jgi:hypothetical protein
MSAQNPFVHPDPVQTQLIEITARRGITLRDEIAVQILPAIYADYQHTLTAQKITHVPPHWRDGLAADAYAMADAMLRQRGRETDTGGASSD